MRNYKRVEEVGMHRESKERRAHNAVNSAKTLTEQGIEFENKNNGTHLIVRVGDCVVDFWPTTGRWIPRPARASRSDVAPKGGRGVFNLIAYLKCAPRYNHEANYGKEPTIPAQAVHASEDAESPTGASAADNPVDVQ